MYLDKLEIYGFKSFAHKLTLEFGPGITGVVGPNGCGKTNVADAIRWVLGEQSAAELRGSSMADVVFNGTKKRRRLGRAEVNLTIDNSGGYLPTDYSKVVIGRKVYRSGESEYMINKTPCRLRDIKDLFLDTGIGTRTYSLIERKMVDSVLSDSAGHRRFMFEEAAGIMKYKVRKRSTLNKLAATEADMQRVADIISEVEKQVRSLKRQLAQARRHRRYTDELSRLEVGLARRDFDEWQGVRQAALERAAELRAKIASFGELLERDDSATREAREALSAHEETLAGLDGNVSSVDAEARNLADGLLVARERKRAAERRVEELSPEIASLRAELDQIRSQIDALAASLTEARDAARDREAGLAEKRAALKRIDREYWEVKKALAGQKQTQLEGLESSAGLKGELESYRARLDDLIEEHGTLERSLAEARSDLTSRESAVLDALEEEKRFMSAARETREREVATENDLDIAREALLTSREGKTRAEGELEAARHKLVLLKEMRDGYGGFAAGVRALLTDRSQHSLSGLRGTVADVIQVDPSAAAAVESALAGAAQYVVADRRVDARRALDHLGAGTHGRATFVPLDEVTRVSVRETPETVLASADVLGSASSFVQCDDAVRPVLDLLLEGAVVVRNLETAIRMASEHRDRGLTFVTSEGEAVSAEGLMTGGSGSAEAGLLRRKERVVEAEREVTRLEQLLVDTRRLEVEAREALERLTSRSRECGEQTEQAEADLWEAKRRLTELELAKTSAASRVEELSLRRDALGERMKKARHDIEVLGGQLARLSRGEDEIGMQLDDLQRRYSDLEASREAATEDQRLAELEAASTGATLKQLESEQNQLQARAAAAQTAIDRKTGEHADHGEAIRELAAKLAEDGQRLDLVTARQEELKTRRDAVRDETRRLRARLDEVESTSRTAREERDGIQRELHEIELRDTELRGRSEALRDRILEDYDIDVAVAPRPAVPTSGEAGQTSGEEAPSSVSDDGEAAADGAASIDEKGAEGAAGVESGHHVALMLDESDEPVDWEQTRQEVERLKARLRSMGPVNLLALDEYDEESKRLEFLQAQYEDLERSKASLIEAIAQINGAARKMFVETFEQVRENFVSMFKRLFEGGEADLRLLDPDDPLESPIEIVASPREKKLGRLSLLSGGERALTAIALLFAIYLVKPSPFCILDEVDAPLDDANVKRFIRMLKEFSERTQFIIITHNKVTMAATDRLYGVTMEESGVSKVVSVMLDAMGNEVDREEIAYEAV